MTRSGRGAASPPTLLYGATLVARHRGGLRLVETELFLDDGRVATVGRAVTMLPGTRVLELRGALVAGLVRPGAIGPDLAAPPALASFLAGLGVDGWAPRLGAVEQGDAADLVVFSPVRGLAAATSPSEAPTLLADATVWHLFLDGRQRIRDGAAV